MSKYVNLWMAMSQQALTQFNDYRAQDTWEKDKSRFIQQWNAPYRQAWETAKREYRQVTLPAFYASQEYTDWQAAYQAYEDTYDGGEWNPPVAPDRPAPPVKPDPPVQPTDAEIEAAIGPYPDDYSGPMDETTYKVLTKMYDIDNVQSMFKTTTAGGKTYTLFSLYLVGSAKAKAAIDEMTAKWPGHFIVIGAWRWDGRQVGTQFTYQDIIDEDNNVIGQEVTGVTGTPTYPIPNAAYKLMPDVVTYNENGDETSRTVASSNADLRDINLLSGQSRRIFT
jgi:hypothetical protein